VLHRRAAGGMVVGGTSAGAAVMSSTMIVEGETRSPRASAVHTGPGLEFLPGIIIDQHFAQRGRLGRLLSVVAQFPHQLGIGIDEDTALVIEGHEARVIGSGAITIVDAGSATRNDGADVPAGAAITLCGVTLHSLPRGQRFDLSARSPLSDSTTTTD
ncbi:MAG: cyanophycinase, partial [Myxococcales bacterium]